MSPKSNIHSFFAGELLLFKVMEKTREEKKVILAVGEKGKVFIT